MYGLPKEFDATTLVGQLLVQVCFGVGQIQLHFDKSLTIAVTSAFWYRDSAASGPQRINIPGSHAVQCHLLQLLHRTILSARGDEFGTLTLEFDSGHTLELLDENPAYEAYQIRIGEKLIVV